MAPSDFLDSLAELFLNHGASLYGGEAVTQLEHALQCAQLAEQSAASPSFIVAALLHDVGHLLDIRDCHADDPLHDLQHEVAALNFLTGYFGDEVLFPIRYHVAAKRYLCSVNNEYIHILSSASQASLRVQGNLMVDAEIREFESLPHLDAILAVRRWDDAAKVPGLKTPPFAYYRPALEACLVAS